MTAAELLAQANSTMRQLAEGVAQQLAADLDPALGVTWQPEGLYPQGVIGIYMADYPTDPDITITLSPRPVTADPMYPDSEYALQVRLRGTTDPYVVWGLRDAVRAVIAGRWPHVLPNGLPIKTVDFRGGTPLGQDKADRHQWSDNWMYGLGEYRARPF